MLLERTDLRLPHLILGEVRAGPHFWRVRARAESGQLSEWGEVMRFTAACEPAGPPRRKTGGPLTTAAARVRLTSGSRR